ncbi:MAG: hypothetical protein ACKO1M_06045, partial [Planctomycetota bacterium]
MAHDDDKPEAGDDSWAGFEAESQADSAPEFTFSFDDDAVADATAGDDLVDKRLRDDEMEADDEVAEEIAFGEPDAALDALLADGL